VNTVPATGDDGLAPVAAEPPEAMVGAARAPPTLSKNSPAIRFETDPSIRCPTPPTMPPTEASAA
jgi:hypothetical protein